MAASLYSSSLLFFVALLTISISEAKEHLIGGEANAWRIPPSAADSLNKWAEVTRFQVGDLLVWKYDGAKDSVLEVTREGYMKCERQGPISEHKDGSTKVVLERPGAHYFISGASGACQKGEKLIVVVLSPRHRLISPAPSPAEQEEGPAAAPTSGAAELAGGWRGVMLLSTLFVLGLVGMMV